MDFGIFTMVLMLVPIHPKVCGAYNETPSLVIYPWEKFCALVTINLREQRIHYFPLFKMDGWRWTLPFTPHRVRFG
jgi:hypothetical protein